MISGRKVIGFIPAKGISRRVPQKNLAICGGKHLVLWTLDAAHGSKYIDEIIVSTDENRVSEVIYYHWWNKGPSQRQRLIIDKRARYLCEPEVGATDVVLEYLDRHQGNLSDVIVLLQPTSPVRTSEHIDEAIRLYGCTFCPTVSVSEESGKVNGAIYIKDVGLLIKSKSFQSGAELWYHMSTQESIDVDTFEDLQRAESYLREKNGRE